MRTKTYEIGMYVNITWHYGPYDKEVVGNAEVQIS